MAKISFTPQQQNAISSRGGNILVSAAAGSGKTAVLTQRVVERLIKDEPPVPADKLMIVTFTKASAAEMKTRIKKKLSDMSLDDPSNELIRKQINLFEKAKIGTIDSCCSEILKYNFGSVGLPASFSIGEEKEIRDLQISSVNEVLEKEFSSPTPALIELSDLFGGRQDIVAFRDAVLKILEFAYSIPFYKEWLLSAYKNYDSKNPDNIKIWTDLVFESAEREFTTAKAFFTSAREMCLKSKDLEAYVDTFNIDLEVLGKLSAFIKNKDLDGTFNFLKDISFIRLKTARAPRQGKEESNTDFEERLAKYNKYKEPAKNLRTDGKKIIAGIKENIITSTEAELVSDMDYFLPLVEKLFNIANDADDIIFQKKIEKKMIDFSDLEQLTLKLLANKTVVNGQEVLIKTDIAQRLSDDIAEIMVDEYQDVNRVQDAILISLSNGKNRFMVGDVKQSIYRFRQACPDLFMELLEKFNDSEKDIYPKKILLNGNFRTRKEITDFINPVFTNIMTKKAAEIDYADGHLLEPKAEPQSNLKDNVEIVIAEDSRNSDEESREASEAEAHAAAAKVSELLSSGIVIGRDEEQRPLRPSDIAILMRNPRNKAETYKNALNEYGIKSSSSRNDDFFTAYEIKPMLNLLEAIGNPARDMELIGAMLSPLFGFSDEEVVRIKLLKANIDLEKYLVPGVFAHFFKGTGGITFNYRFPKIRKQRNQIDHTFKNIYTALSCCPEGSAGKKFKDFFDSLIVFSKTNTPSALINKIYYDTGYKTLISAMENGEEMAENLNRLLVYAENLKGRIGLGLNGFLKSIASMRENSISLTSKAAMGQDDAVTITSIHSSKGLEWPVVILSESAAAFSFYKNDYQKTYILDKTLGFASKRRNNEDFYQFNTLPLAAAKYRIKSIFSAEEMRLLYVAMTRAKEKLIITGRTNNFEKLLNENVNNFPDEYMPDIVYSKKNYLDWILTGLNKKSFDDFLRSDNVRIIPFYYAKNENKEEKQNEEKALPDEDLANDLRERLSFKYPYEKASLIPSKIAVSKLTGNLRDSMAFKKKPLFLNEDEDGSKKPAAGSQKGTAFHKFMELCNFKSASLDAEKEAQRLKEQGLMNEDELELVDFAKIENLMRGPLGELILSSDKILREHRFFAPATVSMHTRELCADEESATTLEGVADLIAIKEGKLYLIDYKTDRIRKVDELRELYRDQVLIYKDMLAFAFKMPVEKVLLYSFHLGRIVEVREKDLLKEK